MFSIRKSSKGDAGLGVFAKTDIPMGTTLTYFGIVRSDEDEVANEQYNMICEVVGEDGEMEELEGLVIDGDPVHLPEPLQIASRINEASTEAEHNVIFRPLTDATEDHFIEMHAAQKPVAACLCVLTRNVAKGEELLTSYGNEYGEREYEAYEAGDEST